MFGGADRNRGGLRGRDGRADSRRARRTQDAGGRCDLSESPRGLGRLRPVLVAVREQVPNNCVLGEVVANGDYYGYRVYDSEAKGELSEYGGGAIGGRLDDLRPKVLRHYHDAFTRGFIAGAPGLLEISGGLMSLFSWNDGSHIKEVWSSSQDNGLAQNYQFFFGSTLFWASDDDAINKQKVFTDVGGVKDLLSFGGDTTRGIADLGTDGQQLVWIEGTDRPQPNGVYPKVAPASNAALALATAARGATP
jgi:hypothetical protein